MVAPYERSADVIACINTWLFFARNFIFLHNSDNYFDTSGMTHHLCAMSPQDTESGIYNEKDSASDCFYDFSSVSLQC